MPTPPLRRTRPPNEPICVPVPLPAGLTTRLASRSRKIALLQSAREGPNFRFLKMLLSQRRKNWVPAWFQVTWIATYTLLIR